MKIMIAALLTVLPCLAYAADAPPRALSDGAATSVATPATAPAPVLPITVPAADLTAIQTYLNAQPFSVVSPIVNYLTQREAIAQAEAAAAKDKAVTPVPKK